MTDLPVAASVFGGMAILSMLLSVVDSRAVVTARAWFHYRRFLSLSLIAVNITVGTGLVYVLSLSGTFGWPVILLPLGIMLGYKHFADAAQDIASLSYPRGPSIIALLHKAINSQVGTQVPFRQVIGLSLSFTFILGISFEIIATAELGTPLLTTTPGPGAAPMIAGVLFLTGMVTALAGGSKSATRFDIAQLLFVILLFVLLASAVLDAWQTKVHHSIPVTTTAAAAGLLAFANAYATQLYSIMNWSYAGTAGDSTVKSFLSISGGTTSVLMTLLVVLGVLCAHMGEDPLRLLMQEYYSVAGASSIVGYIVQALVGAGVAAAVLSTVDSGIVRTAQTVYESLGSSFSEAEAEQPNVLRRARWSIALVATGVFGGLLLVHQLHRNLLHLLLLIAAGVPAWAPALRYAARLARQDALVRFTRRVLFTYFSIYIGAFIVAFMLFFLLPLALPYVGVGAFLIACVFTGYEGRR